MNLLILFRYIKGFIQISVKEGFSERFINLCTRNQIVLWDIVSNPEEITVKLYAEDFIRLRDLSKKSGVKIQIVKKCGLYFWLNRYKTRKVLMVGILISIIIMFCMNMFVWNINVYGNNKIGREEIINILEELGLKTGTFSPLFNESEVARKAVNLFDGRILWLSVNIKGSKAIIEVRESSNENKNKDSEKYPCNLVSDCDGILRSAQTFYGEQKAYVGSPVSRDTLLISGIFENADGSIGWTHADGIFIAETKRIISKKYRKADKANYINVDKERFQLTIFNIKIPLNLDFFKKIKSDISYSKSAEFNRNILPFTLSKAAGIKKEVKDIVFPEIFCLDEFTCSEYNKFRNSKIIDAEYQIIKNENHNEINAYYTCLDYIGKKVIITTNQ